MWLYVVLSWATGETKQQEAQQDLADFPAVFFHISHFFVCHESYPTNPKKTEQGNQPGEARATKEVRECVNLIFSQETADF